MSEEYSVRSSAVAGAITGAITRLLTAPLDVLKIRLQINCNNSNYNYNKIKNISIINHFKYIVQNEGYKALWHGYLLFYSYLICYFIFYDISCNTIIL